MSFVYTVMSLQMTQNYVFSPKSRLLDFLRYPYSTSPFTITIVATKLLLYNHNRSFQACISKEPSGHTRIGIKAISLRKCYIIVVTWALVVCLIVPML